MDDDNGVSHGVKTGDRSQGSGESAENPLCRGITGQIESGHKKKMQDYLPGVRGGVPRFNMISPKVGVGGLTQVQDYLPGVCLKDS